MDETPDKKSCWDVFRGRPSRDEGDPSTPSAVRRKELDRPATLARYEKRIREMPDSSFAELQDAYLSTFDCYCNIHDDVPNERPLCNHAVVLMRVARSRGFNVLGVTSERSEHGEHCVQLPPPHDRSHTPVVYVGKYNYFTKNKSSKWRLLPRDKAFREVLEF